MCACMWPQTCMCQLAAFHNQAACNQPHDAATVSSYTTRGLLMLHVSSVAFTVADSC